MCCSENCSSGTPCSITCAQRAGEAGREEGHTRTSVLMPSSRRAGGVSAERRLVGGEERKWQEAATRPSRSPDHLCSGGPSLGPFLVL